MKYIPIPIIIKECDDGVKASRPGDVVVSVDSMAGDIQIEIFQNMPGEFCPIHLPAGFGGAPTSHPSHLRHHDELYVGQ